MMRLLFQPLLPALAVVGIVLTADSMRATTPVDGFVTVKTIEHVLATSAAASIGDPEECGYCHEWENAFGWWHDFGGQGVYLKRVSAGEESEHEDNDDRLGRCTFHAWCVPTLAYEVQDAASSDAPERIWAILASSQEYVRFNAERRALQVYDCTGNIAAHIPLSRGTAEALTLP